MGSRTRQLCVKKEIAFVGLFLDRSGKSMRLSSWLVSILIGAVNNRLSSFVIGVILTNQ